MFLPTTSEEMRSMGWDVCDVILVTGDTYIDSPFIGAAVIGRWLEKHGFRVGLIAQPDPENPDDIRRLGEPRLFWGVSAGSLDSMVANYTATRKWRNRDDLTPGGVNRRRPNRASIVYTNMIRRWCKPAVPIVLGGIEASLRRLAHYDFWTDTIRKSILFNAKADYLVYGMAERTVLELARALAAGEEVTSIRGLCYKSDTIPRDYITMPSFEEISHSPEAFISMFRVFSGNLDPLTARGLAQQQDKRRLVQNPPSLPLSQAELDEVSELPFTREIHPFYAAEGAVPAQETITFSIPALRGCYGGCSFCSIAAHQGRRVIWRSEESILREAERLTRLTGFKGIISDVGGPTANMYGFECRRKLEKGACPTRECLFPDICPELPVDHRKQIELLAKIRRIPGVRRVFVASGLRHDLILADSKNGEAYLEELLRHHTSGQLKIAPEHTDSEVTDLMRKPSAAVLERFLTLFDKIRSRRKLKGFLSYYLIAAHPGCSEREMSQLRRFVQQHIHIIPEQVQIFTPLPSTWSAVMYYTGLDPFTGRSIFVERNLSRKQRQKDMITGEKKKQRSRE